MNSPHCCHLKVILSSLVLATALASVAPKASGTSYNWTGTTSGAWNLAANWDGVHPAFNNQADLVFHNSGAPNLNPNYLGDGDRTIRSLTFNANVASPVALGLDDNAGTDRVLRFEADAGNASLAVEGAATAAITIGSSAFGSISLAANLDITHDSAAALLTLGRPIVETGGSWSVTKHGAGTLVLTSDANANDYSGSTTINGGMLKLGASEVIPDFSSVTVAQGTLDLNGQTETLYGGGVALTLGATNTVAAGNTASVVDSATGGVLKLVGTVAYRAGTSGAHNGTATLSANLDLSGASRMFVIEDSDQTTTETVVDGVIANPAGTGSINKLGPGALELSRPNTYNGLTTVGDGTLRLGVAQALPATTGVTIANGTLDLNGRIQNLSAAAAINLGAAVTTLGGYMASVTDSVGGGVLKMNGVAYNTGSAGFHNGPATLAATLDLNGAGRFFTINDSANAPIDVLISGAIINSVGTGGPILAGTGTTVLSGVNTYNGSTTVRGGTVRLGVDQALPATILAMDCRSGGTATVDLAGHGVTASYLYLSSGAPNAAGSRNLIIDSSSGGILKLNGSVQYLYGAANRSNGQSTVSVILDLNGTNRFFTIDDSLQTTTEVVVSGAIVNAAATPAALIKAGAGTLVLSGTNTYDGDTAVTAGTLMLTGGCSMASSPYLSVAAGATLDVSGVTGGFTLAGAQTLGGSGTVKGPLVADGTVSPAGSNLAGTLSVTGNLQFGATGAASLEVGRIDGVLTNDRIQVASGTLNYGGAMNVALLSGSQPLEVNDSFTLFSASGGLGGGFTATNLPSGYTWDTSLLHAGILKVSGIASPIPTTPTNITYAVSNGTLTVSWPSNYVGWSLQAQTNPLSTGLSANWVTVDGSAEVSSMSFPVDTNKPSVFYRLFYHAP